MAEALNVRFGFVAEFAKAKTRVRTPALWDGSRFLDNIEFGSGWHPLRGGASGPGVPLQVVEGPQGAAGYLRR